MIKGCDRLTQPYVKEPIDHSSKPDTQSKALALNISKWLAIILSIEVPHKQLYRCGLHRTRKRESIIGSRCEDSSLLRRNPAPTPFSPQFQRHITVHLLPPVGWDGFWDRSISPIIRSNVLSTLYPRRALASVNAQLNSSPNCRPSSRETCRCSGLRSLLFPTIARGTESAPCEAISIQTEAS